MRVLLYDGLCGFCNGTVQFILRHDPGGSLHFAPLQGKFGRATLNHYPRLLAVDSLVLVDDNLPVQTPPVVKSEAALEIAVYLGWPWKALGLFRVLPRSIRDAAYDLFARHRYRLFGRYSSCPLPDASVRARFLD